MASMLDAQRTGSGGLAKLGDGVRANSDAKTQAGLSRGPNQSKKLINAAWTVTFPAQGATLDLDFANDRGFVRGIGQGKSMDAVTFTRASQGAFVDQNGLLRGMVPNLLQDTQKFESSAWVPLNTIISGDAIESPNINFTANKLTENTLNANHNISQTVSGLSTGQTYSFGVYAKSTERFLQLNFSYTGVAGNPRANFDLVNGVTGTVDGALTASIVDEGNGWYRCSVSFTPNLTSFNIGFTIITSSTATRAEAHLGDGASGVFIWGAQLELGSSATEYFPTNIGEPRFDWASTAVVAQKNLKNLLNNTENFTVANWGSRAYSTTLDAAIAPDGALTADLFVPDTVSRDHYILKVIAVNSGSSYTESIYMKAGGYNYGYLKIQPTGGTPTYGVVVDLTNGTAAQIVSTGGATGSYQITDFGDGWYRVSVTVLMASNNYQFIATAVPSVPASFTSYGDATYAGNGTDGVYFWGAQLELGEAATDYQAIAQPTTTTPLAANPTSNGLLIEEARTNRILWCRDATQANWVKTNVTAAKDQTGVDGVANAASSLTATANDGTCIQTITLASGSRTGSVYLKRLTGTGNIQVTLDGTTYSTVDLSASEWRRIVLSGTVTNPTVGIKLAVSGDAVAMDYGQVEDGSFVTTPILTTTATATRSADNVNLTQIRNWYNGRTGTFLVIAKVFAANGYLFSAPYPRFEVIPTNFVTVRLYNNSVNLDISTDDIRQKTAYAATYNEYYYALAASTGAARETFTGLTRTQNITDLWIGRQFNNTNYTNGYISRLVYYPFVCNAEQIKQIAVGIQ